MTFIKMFVSVSHALEFDGVDFDEPMEVGLEEEKPSVKDEDKSKLAAEVEPKAELKAKAHDPILV